MRLESWFVGSVASGRLSCTDSGAILRQRVRLEAAHSTSTSPSPADSDELKVAVTMSPLSSLQPHLTELMKAACGC